jgi:hypothetical protein
MKFNFSKLDDFAQKKVGTLGTTGTSSNGAVFGVPRSKECFGDTGDIPVSSASHNAALSPMSPESKTFWGHKKPSVYAVVPNVPNVPSKKTINSLDEDERYIYEERAAILEYEAGFDRATAERMAARMLGLDEASPEGLQRTISTDPLG